MTRLFRCAGADSVDPVHSESASRSQGTGPAAQHPVQPHQTSRSRPTVRCNSVQVEKELRIERILKIFRNGKKNSQSTSCLVLSCSHLSFIRRIMEVTGTSLRCCLRLQDFDIFFHLCRQMILTGCVAFAEHVGPTRVESELLPQCWEQVGTDTL